jgi:hypothetical protein
MESRHSAEPHKNTVRSRKVKAKDVNFFTWSGDKSLAFV